MQHPFVRKTLQKLGVEGDSPPEQGHARETHNGRHARWRVAALLRGQGRGQTPALAASAAHNSPASRRGTSRRRGNNRHRNGEKRRLSRFTGNVTSHVESSTDPPNRRRPPAIQEGGRSQGPGQGEHCLHGLTGSDRTRKPNNETPFEMRQ